MNEKPRVCLLRLYKQCDGSCNKGHDTPPTPAQKRLADYVNNKYRLDGGHNLCLDYMLAGKCNCKVRKARTHKYWKQLRNEQHVEFKQNRAKRDEPSPTGADAPKETLVELKSMIETLTHKVTVLEGLLIEHVSSKSLKVSISCQTDNETSEISCQTETHLEEIATQTEALQPQTAEMAINTDSTNIESHINVDEGTAETPPGDLSFSQPSVDEEIRPPKIILTSQYEVYAPTLISNQRVIIPSPRSRPMKQPVERALENMLNKKRTRENASVLTAKETPKLVKSRKEEIEEFFGMTESEWDNMMKSLDLKLEKDKAKWKIPSEQSK